MGPTQLNLSTANSKQSIEELKVKIWKEEGRDKLHTSVSDFLVISV